MEASKSALNAGTTKIVASAFFSSLSWVSFGLPPPLWKSVAIVSGIQHQTNISFLGGIIGTSRDVMKLHMIAVGNFGRGIYSYLIPWAALDTRLT